MCGKRRFQPFFEQLHRFALRGMNYHVKDVGLVSTSGEINAIKYIRKLVGNSNNIILFDVGANAGNYSCQLVTAFEGAPATIHAFEPSYIICKRLIMKMLPHRSVTAHYLGMSDKKDKVKLYRRKEAAMGTSLYPGVIPEEKLEPEEVTLTTIDEFCRENGISHIDLLKLDIEGHELKALQGAAGMIREKRIRFIQFEFSFADINSRVFFRDFFSLLNRDYRLYRIVKDGLYPVKKYTVQQEVFLVANFLAELKTPFGAFAGNES